MIALMCSGHNIAPGRLGLADTPSATGIPAAAGSTEHTRVTEPCWSHQLDSRGMAGHSGETSVPRQQWRVERFGQAI
jgi:hypothetical protein